MSNNSIKDLLCDLGVCREDSIVHYYSRVRDREDVSVMKCNSSGVLFLSRADHMDISHYRSKQAFGYWGGSDRRAAVAANYEDDRRRFEQHRGLVSNKKWLDIGTGAGGILDLLSQHAAQVVAVEPQNHVRDFLVETGYEVYAEVEDIPYHDLQVATMFHVFEHLTDPVDFLIALKSKMAKGATIVIEVPHAKDFLLSVLESESFKSFTFWSEHLLLHTRESLKVFLEAAGFSNISIQGFQRYPLANHLYWLAKNKPGGHVAWSFLKSEHLDSSFGDMLKSIDCTDTLIALATA